MNTTTLTCIGFIQSLSRNYKDAVDTFHKALGQKREDTFSSTMLTCVLEMCIDEPTALNGYLDEDEKLLQMCGLEDPKTKHKDSLNLNDDNDSILSFRNPKFRLWNRKLRKKTDEDDDTSIPMEDDNSAMVVDSSVAAEDSSYNMDLSTNMSTNSDSFK